MTAAGTPDGADLVRVGAERAEARAEAEAEPAEAVHRVEDLPAGGVPARRYRPERPRGTLLYLHGGGFVLGDLTTHDGISRRLANRTGWSVLLVDYRRAPEHPWPAADRDCAAAADWLAPRTEGPLVVVGDSAGAALALGETLRNPERYAAQVLVYPFVDPAGGSYDRDLTGLDLPLERAAWFWDLYQQGQDTAGDDALHVLERDVTGLPPTLLQLAELDVLTPTGHLLADRLAGAGVAVTTEVYPDVQHGFWRHLDNDQAEPALADLGRFLDRVV